MAIHITDKAKQELRNLDVGDTQFLRISVIPGGCSGMTYSAAVDSDIGDADETVFDEDRIRVVADSGSALFLDGLQIDFSDDLVTSGFRFRNPNAAKSCGCGSSFGA